MVGEDASAEINAHKAKLDAMFGGGAAKPAVSWGAPEGQKSERPEDVARAKLDALFKK